jgi:hypothetical protein
MAKQSTSGPFSLLSLIYIPVSLLTLIFVLLAKSIITIPYLSGATNVLTTALGPIISPIPPFISPLFQVGIIHIWRHLNRINYEPSTATKAAVLGMLGQYVPTAVIAGGKVWSWWKQGLGMKEAWKGFVECGILVVLMAAEGTGLRWERGLLDGAVEECLRMWEEGFGDGERQSQHEETATMTTAEKT